jgi:hypothetical protein
MFTDRATNSRPVNTADAPTSATAKPSQAVIFSWLKGPPHLVRPR